MSNTTIPRSDFGEETFGHEDLQKYDKPTSAMAIRSLWRKSHHASTADADQHETIRRILISSAKRGLSEAESRDLAIDAGVNIQTAEAVAAHVYRDFRHIQRDLRAQLKGSLGRWTVDTDGGLELPVCHNIRVDWTQDPPLYHDPLKKSSKKYQRWLSALQTGYAVIQKGKMENGTETRTRAGYLGIYRIDRLEVQDLADGETVDVTFRLTEEARGVPSHSIKTGET